MNERKLFQRNGKKANKGITLIALVISIIVMLILAGVSLNATIGENGIVTQAQNATYMQSIAVLEEYLNSYYIEHYDELNKFENKAEALQNYSQSSDYIWNPSKYGYGTIGYVVDSDGSACYFINKSGLPDEIKQQLKGGDAGEGTYADYAGFNDVYGVTSNLQVYYCSNNKEDILGISKEDLDKDNPLREIFSAGTEMAKLVTGNSEDNVTAEDLKSIKKLTINSENQVTSLKELYNFTSLEELTLSDIELSSLNGIENATQLNYIYFYNTTINDYTSIGKLKKLSYLYMEKTNDEEVKKLCEGIKDANLQNLEDLGFFNSFGNLTDISILSILTDNTKKAIKRLDLYSNNLSEVNCLQDFTNIEELRIQNNVITTLTPVCKNMINLKALYAANNKLGIDEIYNIDLENDGKNELADAISGLSNKTNLTYVDLKNNADLKWIDYLKENVNIRNLYLDGCNNLVGDSVSNIRDILIGCKGNYTIPSKYSLALLGDDIETLDLSKQKINKDNFATLKGYTNIKKLNISNIQLVNDSDVEISNEEFEYCINDVLSTLTGVEILFADNLPKLTNASFLRNMDNLIALSIIGTSIRNRNDG